jgi:hypothetical protein
MTKDRYYDSIKIVSPFFFSIYYIDTLQKILKFIRALKTYTKHFFFIYFIIPQHII